MIERVVERLIRQRIVEAGRYLSKVGYIKGREGNISGRHGDMFWITPHDALLSRLNPYEIVKVKGTRIPPYASSEAPLHRLIYRRRKDVRYIIHIHPINIISYAERCKGEELWDEVRIYVGNVITIPYYKPGTEELWRSVSERIEMGDFFILRKHGIISIDTSMERAIEKIEIMDKMAEVKLKIL